MQLGHDHLHGGHAFLGMDIHRNTAPVIANSHAVVSVQNNSDPRTEAGHGFVNGVVHYLVHQMVQAARVCRAYVHGRALAHSRKAFQNGNGRGVVPAVAGFRSH